MWKCKLSLRPDFAGDDVWSSCDISSKAAHFISTCSGLDPDFPIPNSICPYAYPLPMHATFGNPLVTDTPERHACRLAHAMSVNIPGSTNGRIFGGSCRTTFVQGLSSLECMPSRRTNHPHPSMAQEKWSSPGRIEIWIPLDDFKRVCRLTVSPPSRYNSLRLFWNFAFATLWTHLHSLSE